MRRIGRISELWIPFATAAAAAARAFKDFTPDNDPDGEHDFGAFMIEEQHLFWKIDYYDPTLRYGSARSFQSHGDQARADDHAG